MNWERIQTLSAAQRQQLKITKPDEFGEAITAAISVVLAEYRGVKNYGLSAEFFEWLLENYGARIDQARKSQETKLKNEADNAAAAKAQIDAATVAANNAGQAWAPIFIKLLEDRAFQIKETVFYPLDVTFWRPDCQKIVDEATARSLPLSDEANVIDIIRNLARAGEIHMRDLLTGESITGSALLNYEPQMLNELLKPTAQRRDFRTSEEFLRTDPSILAEEKRINDELLMRDLDAEFKRLARVEPSFHDTPENRQRVFDYCRSKDLLLRQESLAAAFREMWEKGLVGKIPNVDISTGVTSARINPEKWRDESDEAQAFRREVRDMDSTTYDKNMQNPSFRERADKWL